MGPTDADTEAGRAEGRYEAIYGVMRECFSQDNYGRKCARKMTEKILRRLRQSDPGGPVAWRYKYDDEPGWRYRESKIDLPGPILAGRWDDVTVESLYAGKAVFQRPAAPTDEAPEGDCICVEPSPHLPGDTGVVMECPVHGEVPPPVEEGERGEDDVMQDLYDIAMFMPVGMGYNAEPTEWGVIHKKVAAVKHEIERLRQQVREMEQNLQY